VKRAVKVVVVTPARPTAAVEKVLLGLVLIVPKGKP
jgi:hypothetical protein